VIPIWLRTETRYQPIRIIEIFIVNLVSAFEERLRSEKIRSEEMRKQLFVGNSGQRQQSMKNYSLQIQSSQ
jgi:hypothetical protein